MLAWVDVRWFESMRHNVMQRRRRDHPNRILQRSPEPEITAIIRAARLSRPCANASRAQRHLEPGTLAVCVQVLRGNFGCFSLERRAARGPHHSHGEAGQCGTVPQKSPPAGLLRLNAHVSSRKTEIPIIDSKACRQCTSGHLSRQCPGSLPQPWEALDWIL